MAFTDNWFKNIFCVCCCQAIIFILLTYISHFHCFNRYLDHCRQQDSIRWYVIEKSLCLSRTSILIQWVFGFLLFFCLFVWFYLIDMHFFIFFITEMQSAWVWYTNWECRRKQTSLVYCVHIYGFWWWWRCHLIWDTCIPIAVLDSHNWRVECWAGRNVRFWESNTIYTGQITVGIIMNITSIFYKCMSRGLLYAKFIVQRSFWSLKWLYVTV